MAATMREKSQLGKGRFQKKGGIFHTLVEWVGLKVIFRKKKYGLKMHKIT